VKSGAGSARAEPHQVTVRLVRMAGWLSLAGGILSIPASLSLQPHPPATDFLLTGAIAGLGLFGLLAPERWLSPAWIYIAIVGGIIEVTASVLVFSDDYTFYFVLVSIYAAYALPTRRALAICLAGMTIALGFSVLVEVGDSNDSEHEEGIHPALVTLPVMLISAAAIRERRERLEQRERRYRRFAYEAVELAIRIRGSRQRRAGRETRDDLDIRLDQLASQAEDAAHEEGLELGLGEPH
jgi:hypothetical protein